MSLSYAVIGTGYWGSNHARVAAELLDDGILDSVILCDLDEDRVSDLANRYGLPYTTDYETLADRGVTAVTVATPSTTHREIAVELLNDGLDVLVEKPLATTSEDAWKIVETANTNDCVLAVGHIFRYHPALTELKRRIDIGELGRITHLMTNRVSFRVPRKQAGALYSLGVHDLDIYSYLLDEQPTRLYCQLQSSVRDTVDETATVVLTYEEATGVINESWHVPVHGKRRDLTVVGSKQTAHLDYLEDTAFDLYDAQIISEDGTLKARDEGARRHETEPGEPLRIEIESFIDACDTRTEPRASGRVGAETVDLLEAAARSDERGEVVSVFD